MKKIIDIYILKGDKTSREYIDWYINNLKTQKIAWAAINIETINFDEKISENIFNAQKIKEIIKIAMNEAKWISGKEPYQPKQDSFDKIVGSFNSILNKAYYREELTIFEFMIEIFFNVIKGHHLFNGNKRTAVALLSVLAIHLGYKLIYIYEDHALDVERFAEITSKNDAIPQMITWFKKNVIIKEIKTGDENEKK